MKVGCQVRPRLYYSYQKLSLGLIVAVKKDFYRNPAGLREDCFSVYWSHGELYDEPASFLEVVPNESR